MKASALPNALTILRLALIPVIAWFLTRERYGMAFALFLVAAFTDLADGYLARRLGVVSRLGATLGRLDVVFATVLASGAQYVWVWSRKALAARAGG